MNSQTSEDYQSSFFEYAHTVGLQNLSSHAQFANEAGFVFNFEHAIKDGYMYRQEQ